MSSMEPQAPGQNPYDFIMNSPSNQPRRSLLGGSGQRKIIAVAFVLVVVMGAVVLFSVFNSLGKKNYRGYTEVAQRQTELLRVADLGLTKARSGSTKNYVATVRAVVASEKTETLALLSKKHIKVTDKEMAARRDSDTDKALTSADQTTDYDDKLLGLLNEQLLAYQKAARDTSAAPTGTTEKALAATYSSNAKVFLNAQ